MTEQHSETHRPATTPKPPTPGARDNLRCLDCARARREGRDHGCLVHVAEDVFP
jgi:hypothetical protein